MPPLEQLSQLQFISYESALIGLFITAGVILLTRDWRLLILALLIQYIMMGFILAQLVRPDIAILKVMIGAFICPILFISARQVSVSAGAPIPATYSESRTWFDRFLDYAERLLIVADDRRQTQAPAPTGHWFRVFLTLLLIVVTILLSRSFPLPQLPPAVTMAVYWLGLAGLLILTLTEDPLKVGVGLFTLLTGFGLYYAVLESSLLLAGLWGAAKLLLALAIGYLAVVRGTGPEGGV
jgi:hypothetical protein